MRSVWEELYRTHRQGFFTLALSITGRVDRAEDAVHEAFAKLFGRSDRPSGEPAAYAFSVVRNAAIDQLRKAGRDRTARQSIYEEAGPSKLLSANRPDSDAHDTERREAIQAALDKLNDEQREVIVMKIYGGLTFDQIGQAIGAPLSTVASRYRRGLARLETGLKSWL